MVVGLLGNEWDGTCATAGKVECIPLNFSRWAVPFYRLPGCAGQSRRPPTGGPAGRRVLSVVGRHRAHLAASPHDPPEPAGPPAHVTIGLVPYVLLGLAIAFEVCATLALRGSEGFTKVGPSVIVVVGYLLSFGLMAKALTSLNVGPVYAIWSALGTIGAFVGGVVLFDEPVRPVTIVGVVLIVVGVVVMQLGGGVSRA